MEIELSLRNCDDPEVIRVIAEITKHHDLTVRVPFAVPRESLYGIRLLRGSIYRLDPDEQWVFRRPESVLTEGQHTWSYRPWCAGILE